MGFGNFQIFIFGNFMWGFFMVLFWLWSFMDFNDEELVIKGLLFMK